MYDTEGEDEHDDVVAAPNSGHEYGDHFGDKFVGGNNHIEEKITGLVEGLSLPIDSILR